MEEISSSLHEEKRRLQSLRERAAKEKEETEAFVYSADDTVASIMGKQVPSSAAVAEEAESYLASLSKKDPGLKATRRSVRLWDTDRGQPRTPAPSKAQAGAGRPPPSTSGARRFVSPAATPRRPSHPSPIHRPLQDPYPCRGWRRLCAWRQLPQAAARQPPARVAVRSG